MAIRSRLVYEWANVHRRRPIALRRALLNWNQLQLARAANIGSATLKRFEVGLRTPIPNNMAAIRKVLEYAGIKFIDRGKSGGPGG
jgi:transcriptional regulator with XRE-family HTH domain